MGRSVTREVLAALGTLALCGCAGTSGSVSVSGTRPEDLRSAPAAAAVLVFLDLERLRPDLLANLGDAVLPAGVQATPAPGGYLLTLAGVPAAGGGTLAGTVQVQGPVARPGGAAVYTETFALTAASGARSWAYSGAQRVTVAGGSARVALVDQPIQAVLTDASASPAKVRSFAFTPLAFTEALDARIGNGGFQFQEVLGDGRGDLVTAAILLADPLVWDPRACPYPAAGSLGLTLTTFAAGASRATVSFDAGCGTLTVDGQPLALCGS